MQLNNMECIYFILLLLFMLLFLCEIGAVALILGDSSLSSNLIHVAITDELFTQRAHVWWAVPISRHQQINPLSV